MNSSSVSVDSEHCILMAASVRYKIVMQASGLLIVFIGNVTFD